MKGKITAVVWILSFSGSRQNSGVSTAGDLEEYPENSTRFITVKLQQPQCL